METLEKAEEQIFQHQQEVAYDTREFTIELLVSKYKTGIENEENEIYVPEYQREFVWDPERQSKFIESVILGLPIPFIFVAEMPESGRLEIVDGSQRIRTLNAFLDNNLKLKKLDMLTNLDGYYFQNLSIPRQRKFKNTVIRMVVLSDKTTESIKTEMFKRINRGSDTLNNMEVRKGLLKGDFGNFIQSLSENELFDKLCPLSPIAKKRQEKQELILRFFAFIDKYPNYDKGLGKFLDAYLDEENKGFSEDKKYKKLLNFDNMLLFVAKHFPNGFVKPTSKIRLASKIYFESIAVGVAFAIQENPTLLQIQKINLDWLNSEGFKKVIEPIFNTHSPKGIKGRIDFVKNSLLGNFTDINEVLKNENED
jgi:hypothetical protein